MKIIRECIPNWNIYPVYTSLICNECQDMAKWHNQTWQGWINFDSGCKESHKCFSPFEKMKFSKYNIFKVFGKDVLIWNTSSGAIIILTKGEYEMARSIIKSAGEKFIDGFRLLLDELFKYGFIVNNEEIESLKFDFIRNALSSNVSNVKNFIILPTTACNGKCFYCFAHNDIANLKSMDSETISKVVDFVCKTTLYDDEIVLRWFGGEPLLGVDIIDSIISGIRKSKHPQFRIYSNITSNGSLLNEKIIIKAKEKWNLKKFHITIDGYKEKHQLRKGYTKEFSGSYETIIENISLLLKHGIYTLVRINLDKKNISDLDKILDDLECFKNNPLFFVHVTNLQPINGCNDIEYLFRADELELFYFGIYDTLFKRKFYKNIEILLPNRLTSLCTASMPNFVLINPSGELFKCDKEDHVKTNSIGDCEKGIIQNENLRKWIETSIDDNCIDCVYLPVCQGGCKYYRFNSNSCDVSPCVKLKYTIDANLNLAYKYFHF